MLRSNPPILQKPENETLCDIQLSSPIFLVIHSVAKIYYQDLQKINKNN